MALKKPITDYKGVKIRYHKIAAFEFKEGKLVVKVRGYVNQVTRDAEKNALVKNEEFFAYDRTTDELKTELDTKSAAFGLMDIEDEGYAAAKGEVIQLTEAYNARVASNDRPDYTPPLDRFYSEEEVELPFDSAVSLESLYNALAQTDKYKDAESV